MTWECSERSLRVMRVLAVVECEAERETENPLGFEGDPGRASRSKASPSCGSYNHTKECDEE